MKLNPIIISLVFSVCVLTGCNRNMETTQKLYLSAVEKYSVHDFEKAEILCNQCIKENPSFFEAKFLKGKIAFFKNDYDNSLEIFRKLCKKYPEFTEARIFFIRNLIVLQDYKKAEELLEKEIRLNGTDWRVFYLYSLLYKNLKMLDKELAMLSNAEKCLEDSAKVYGALAYDWELLGLTEKQKFYSEKVKIVGNFK